MGYRSYFTLSNADTIRDQIVAILPNIDEKSSELYELLTNNICEDTSWYDFDKDILSFSRKYPHIYLKIFVEGEESEDMRYVHVKNGIAITKWAETIYPDLTPDEIELLK